MATSAIAAPMVARKPMPRPPGWSGAPVPLRIAETDEQALAELGKLSGTRFDGMIVRLFARLLKMERTLP